MPGTAELVVVASVDVPTVQELVVLHSFVQSQNCWVASLESIAQSLQSCIRASDSRFMAWVHRKGRHQSYSTSSPEVLVLEP